MVEIQPLKLFNPINIRNTSFSRIFCKSHFRSMNSKETFRLRSCFEVSNEMNHVKMQARKTPN